MKVAYLFNSIKTGSGQIERVQSGTGHDNNLFGMLRLRARGVETDYEEIERYYPRWCTRLLRRFFTIFWVHIFIFPALFRYDLVFTSTAYGSLLLWALYPFKKPRWLMLDFNLLGTVGGIHATRRTFRQRIFLWALSRASGIVTISERERVALETLLPHLKGRITFLHEAVDTKFFSPEHAGQSEKEPPFILSVGLDPSRDFATLIEATKGLGIRLKIATKPERIKEIMPVPDHVTLHHFPHNEMVRQYAAATIVAHTLHIRPGDSSVHNDSMGTFSVVEAMAMGKPVVVTESNSLKSYITHGQTGLFVRVHDSAHVKETLRTLIADRSLQERLGKNARAFALAHCDARQFADLLYRCMMDTL